MANIKLDKQKKTTYSHGQAFSKQRYFGHYLYSDSFNKYLSISYVPGIVLGWGYKRWKYGRRKRGEGNSCNTGIAIGSWVHWNTLNVTETADPWARVDLGQAGSKQGLPRDSVVKNSPAVQGRRRCRLDPRVGKIPWRRARQPTPVFLPGESHGQTSLAGYNPQGRRESDTAKAT